MVTLLGGGSSTIWSTEFPSFSWAANHLQKKHTKRYFWKTNFKQSQHQPTKFPKKHRNTIDIHIHTKWVPTSYKLYLYNSTYRSQKKRETHLFAAIFRGPKKTPVINCLFYNNLFKIHLGSCPTSRGRLFFYLVVLNQPISKIWWSSNWIISPGVKNYKKTFETTLPETNELPLGNGWLEYDRFLLGWPIFRGELLVSGRVPPSFASTHPVNHPRLRPEICSPRHGETSREAWQKVKGARLETTRFDQLLRGQEGSSLNGIICIYYMVVSIYIYISSI